MPPAPNRRDLLMSADDEAREAWTPTTEQVRSHYVFDQGDRWDRGRGEAFDRWLAEHDRALLDSRPVTAQPNEREALAKIASQHYYIERWSGGEATCSCRQWVESVQRKPYTTWGQHLADAILDAGFRLSPAALTQPITVTTAMVNAAALELYGPSVIYQPEVVRAVLEAAVSVPTKGRRCVERGCSEFPDATWDRCHTHQDALEDASPVPTNHTEGD